MPCAYLMLMCLQLMLLAVVAQHLHYTHCSWLRRETGAEAAPAGFQAAAASSVDGSAAAWWLNGEPKSHGIFMFVSKKHQTLL